MAYPDWLNWAIPLGVVAVAFVRWLLMLRGPVWRDDAPRLMDAMSINEEVLETPFWSDSRDRKE